MVVADIAKTPNGNEKNEGREAQSRQKPVFVTLKQISLSILISLSLVTITSPVYGSNIVADKQANKREQPQVISTANGITQVNIQTPNNKGVSHNKYSQFDVSQRGAILNNSSKNSKTQIAGYVQGNELLRATGPAKIILNEVNSRNPSQLNGVIEVAGQKAQVVIANPSGITCNGCGFINASRGTLTTGKPVIENGELRGYVVEGGNISVTGKGLDSSQQDYTDLIARTVSLNSAVWANDVNVVTGRNRVSQDSRTVTPLEENTTNKPEVSIDVSQLGGMYAGKIRMVGTEKGVGVRNAGELGASVGSITISADGKIINKGGIHAKQDITLHSKQDIKNNHQIYSKKNINLKSDKDIVNQGTLIAQNNIDLHAKKINSTQNSTVASGVDEQGKLTKQGNITATAKNIAFNGKNSASQAISLNAKDELNLDKSQVYANDLKLTGESISLQSAHVQTEQQLNLNNSTSINASNAIIQSKNGINLTTNTFTNNNSQLLSENDISLKAKQIDSNASSIYTNNKIDIDAENIALNNATLSAKKAISLSGNALDANNLALTTEDNFTIAGKQVSTQNANIQAKNAINIDANDYIADNLNLVTAQSLTLKADHLQLNQSKINALTNIDVSGKQLDNQAAIWQSNQNISINADAIFNQSSQIKAIGSINYTFNALNNDNATIIGKNLKFTGDTLYNQQAKLKSDEAIIVAVNQLFNHHAQWQSGDNIVVTATKLLDNQNGIIYSKGSLAIDTANMANDNAKLITDKDLQLHAKQLSSDNSVLQAAKTLSVAVDEQFNAKAGSLYANEQITINSNDIDLSNTELNAKQDILLLGQQQVLNQAKFLAGGQIKLDATNIVADDVSLKSISDLTIKSLNSAKFNRGQLITNQNLSLNTQNAQTANATLYAKGGIDVNLNQMQNQNAVWFSGKTINLIAQLLNNQKSSIQAQQNVLINSEQINNAEGVIVADGSLAINATNLDNTSAQLQSKSGTKVQVNNELKNSNTKWFSEGDIDLKASNLANDNAIVDSLGNMLITANNINNSQAKLYANKLININADNINNENSEFFANDSINFVSKILNNQNSDLKAKQNINIQTESLLSDLAKYVAEGDLSFNSQTASFNKAIVASKGNLSIDNEYALTMQEAQLISQKNLQLKANTINSAGSLINSTGYIDVLTQHLINNNAQWVTKGYIKINTDRTDNNNGFLQADNFISILAKQLFNNDSGTLISKNNIELKSDEINNAFGQMGAEGHISIDSSNLKNNEGKLVANDDIIIKATDLDNRSAQLASDKALNIDAKHIDNQKAIFSTKGNITVKADDLDNTSSKLFSGQSITINSDNIINKQAVLKADDAITIDSQQFDNSDATVVAENLIKLVANYINNANATIQSKKQLTINSKQLDNQSALLLSGNNGTNIDTQILNNQQAKLVTTGDLVINANTFANQEAKLVAQQALTINTNQLNNQKAELQAKGDLNINANQLDNQQALFNSENNIQLIGKNGIDNRASQIIANGLIKLTSLNDINNTNAKLLSNNGIALQAANLVNQSTVLKTNGLIKAEAEKIDNRQSEYVANNIMLESNDLNNQLASLTANNNLIINSKDFDNNQGHLLANNISLKTKSFQGNGTIKSQNDLSLDLDDSLINDSELTANGHLSIRTAGDINNKNKITAGKQVTLESQQLINEQQAEISADYVSLKNQTLTNQGLIEGDTAVIQTGGTLDNLATGRIYADNLAIKAFMLNNRGQNGKAPVIAARNNFHLGVNTLNNYTHAQLLSLGNFVIGGDLDANYNVTGMVEVINNHASTIESQANLWITTKALNNTNDHIVTEMRKSDEAPEREEYFEVSGKIGKYSPDQILYRIRDGYFPKKERRKIKSKSLGCEKHDKGCWYLWKDIPERLKPKGALSRIQIIGENYSATNSYHYNIEKTKYRTVVLETDPGKIMASGNLIIQGQIVNNQDSKIVAGKTVNINVDQLNNHSQETISKYVYSGKRIEHWKKHSKDYRTTITDYDKPDEIFIDDALNHNIQDYQAFKPTTVKEESRQTVAVQNTPNEVTLNNVVQTSNQTVGVQLAKPAVALKPNNRNTVQQSIGVANDHKSNKVNPTLTPENNVEQNLATTNPTVNPSKISDSDVATTTNTAEPAKTISIFEPNLTLPDNSLWTVNKSSDKNYVIETDPRFTQRKKWLSSDYMMQRLGADQDSVQKRLGDGYYEQQLIREQIVGLTGNRYLGNYHSDLEQYKALMDAGVSFAQAYGIVPGVELTPEQMQALTTDMVWLVKKTVMVNGQATEVLVPQVYIVNRTKLGTDGALISGENVFIKGKELNSNGLIAAKQDVLLDGYNVTNKGTIYGNRVGINADNDINNYGKLVGNKLVYLDANHDVNLLSTTRTQTRDRNITTNVDQGSTIQVNNGDILINAGHDINSKAGWIINTGKEGETWLQAGHDIQFTTADIEEKFDYRRKKDYRITDEKSVVGTEISAVNDIQLLAGNNINAKTVDIAAGNHLGLQAGNDIDIGSSTETSFLDEFHKEKKKGFLSSTKTTSHVVEDNTTQKGSELSGDTVTINAGNNLNVSGSQVVGTNDVNLKAGKDINIDAAEESYFRKEKTTKKKSGLMSSGGLGFTIGKEKESLKQTDTEQAYLGSVVGSTDGNVNINAGKNINVKASDVIAKQNIKMQGENVNIEALDAKTTHKEEYKYQKSGVSLAITGTASDVYTASQTLQQASHQSNDRTKALMDIKAGLQAGNAALELASNLQNNQPSASIGINASIGTEKTKRTVNQEQHTVIGSSISAGHNATIIAKGNGQQDSGDINIIGSEVKAGHDTTLKANHDVNIIGQENTSKTDTKQKNSSGSISAGYNFGGDKNGFTISASGSKSKFREKGNGTDWTESIVEAGNKVTIVTGNDANIIAGQVKGEQVTADIGHDLNIESKQDSDQYNQKSNSTSVGGSFSLGGSGSLNASNSQTKMKSNWTSVTDQSGIFAGKDGYDITVGNHTDLKGAVIASEAVDTSKNKLDTGTISFSDIENKTDYKVSSSSMGVNTSGMPTPPNNYNKNDKASSTTHSAVSNGTLIVRNEDEQKQDINTLSRDTEHASKELKHIFNKDKEQSIIDQTQLVSEIGGQTLTMLNNFDKITATAAANKAVNDAVSKNKGLSAEKQQEIYKEAYKDAMNNGMTAMGSDTRQGVEMATSIIKGLITGDMTGAAAGALAPKLASEIKKYTEHKDQVTGENKIDYVSNTVAHAILGAVVAELQGNSAIAGGLGAAYGERGAEIIAKILYPNKAIDKLSQEEKQQVSALAQLAAGLTTAALGGDAQDINTAMAGGKNAIENNFLGPQDQALLMALRDKRNKGLLNDKEELLMWLLDELDQKGDYVVYKYVTDPKSLTEDEYKRLAGSLTRYYEQEKELYGEEAANRAAHDLLTGNWGYRPRNYDYPYLGYKEQQDQYLENNYNPTFWERLTSTREIDDNEKYYLGAYSRKKYENSTEWERNVGTTVLIGISAGYIALEAAPIISSCLSQPMICANQLGMFAIDTIGAEAAPMGFSAGAGYLGKKLTQKELNVLAEAMQKDKEFVKKITAALTNEIIQVDKNISYDTSKNIIKLLENNANKAGKGTGGYLNKPEQGGTLNIGAGNKPIEGAYNISHPDYPMGKGVYPGNANDLSNIATGSQNKIIIDNPYGYRPINNEVIRVLNKDGVLIIRGGEGNKYIRNIEKIAADNGLKLVEKKTISSKGYTQSDGSPIKNPNINEYIFKKK
jgi:Haemagluttinin repeat.